MPAHAHWRSPRLHFAHTTPAVLRVENGSRVRAKVQIISLTGGLLCLSTPLNKGCRVKLMFLTDSGSVLGTVEMLPSVSAGVQPFRFLELNEEDQRRLRDLIQVSAELSRLEQQSIIRDRTW